MGDTIRRFARRTPAGRVFDDPHDGFASASDANTWAAKQTFSSEVEIDGALNHDGTTAGFFGVAPTTRPTALTAANASAVDLVYGAEERDVVNNLRIRLNELETRLRSLGLLT